MPDTLARSRSSLAARALAGIALVTAASAPAQSMVQLDPFAQATQGQPACAAPAPPLLTPEAARHEAHVRVERGTRCAMEGRCEPGGAYRRDLEVNERVRAALASDSRFADTSVWVTTSRAWVTLQGCVRRAAQRKALVAFVASIAGVERVFDALDVSTRAATSRK